MQYLNEIILILTPILTSVLGWIAGKLKRNNDFLFELQSSIDMLSERNTKLLHELVEVKSLNQELMVRINQLKIEIEQLRRDSGLPVSKSECIHKEQLV